MPKAITQEETIAGLPGVRFNTDARPDTAQEKRLQEIQSALAEGKVLLPSPTTLPHLSLYEVNVVHAPSFSMISLWVPMEKRSEAVERLQAAGFTVS